MLEIIEHGNVHELRLNRPPVNALNLALIDALGDAITAHAQTAGAIVLSGRPGMFSAGLDVPALLQLNKEETAEFFRSFFKLMEDVARSPVPIVCALTGHSPAGGTVVSIFADYRIMCRGKYRMGLNEVQVGLTVPKTIQAAMIRLTGRHRGEQLMVAGKLLLPDEAYAVGLVDELVDEPDEAVARAIAWCNALLVLPQKAMRETRSIARADLVELFDGFGQQNIDRFVEGWYHESTQSTLKKLVEKLGK